MTEPKPPALPKLPRPKSSLLVRAYGALGLLVLAAYLAAGYWGMSLDSESRDRVPEGVRKEPGGYRGYHLWHSGYLGGK